MVEWHKAQAQQQTLQRIGSQGSHIAAGIHAGFPFLPQQSPTHVKEAGIKRRRIDSIGQVIIVERGGGWANVYSNAGPTTPTRQQSRTNSVASSAPPTTPRGKGLGEFLIAHASPLHIVHQSPAQAQALPWHAQSALEDQRVFNNFFQRTNADGMISGYLPLSPQETLPHFDSYITNSSLQRPSSSIPTQPAHQPTLLQEKSPHPSLEYLQGTQHMGETNDQAQVYDWTDPAPQFEGEAYSVGNGQPHFGNLNFKDFEYDSSFTEGLSAATSNIVPPTGLLLAEEGLGDGPVYQEAHSAVPQQAPQQHTVDPILDPSSGEAQVPISNSMNKDTMANRHVPPQHLPSEVPAMPNQSSSQTASNHPPTSRKRPAPPSSTRPPARSTFAPFAARRLSQLSRELVERVLRRREPCQNCVSSNKTCQRPRCLNFAQGTCASARCPRVHAGETQYRNVIVKPKTLKRIGKRDQRKPSPVELARQQV